MFKFKIKEVIQATGKRYPYRWMMQYFGFHKNKCYKILNNKQKAIDLIDLSYLCEGLKCTPNDLLYWEQTPRLTLPNNHPILMQLTTPNEISDWAEVFKLLEPEKVKKLQQKLLNGEIEL